MFHFITVIKIAAITKISQSPLILTECNGLTDFSTPEPWFTLIYFNRNFDVKYH